MNFLNTFASLFSNFGNLTWQMVVMWGIGALLIYLAIAKKMEPSLPDPWFVLPALMAATMFLQIFLNPKPTDPVQAKVMYIMPLVFSVMFFIFASGLVLYWLTNNVLSIIQQWWINKTIAAERQKRMK